MLNDGLSGRRRNRQGERTRQRVLEAAINCLHKSGYGNTSIESVLTEAGISRGSVLNQFPTRLDLMAATADAAMQVLMADSQARMGETKDPLERIIRHVDVIWETQNIPAAAALSEILLAARWDLELAERLKPVIESTEKEIDRLMAGLATDAGIKDVAEYQLHVRVLILSMRGIAIESTFDNDRAIMRRALERFRQMHRRQCKRLMDPA